MVNYHHEKHAFTDFTSARAKAIEILKGRKGVNEKIGDFSEKVCPIDYDRSKHKISMVVYYKPWNREFWRHKRYSITIECYGESHPIPCDPIFTK
jgi:hypothetical protein